jgi:hypothetical protein
MFRIRYYLVTILCVSLFLSSCKDPKEYNINSSFTDYLQRFEAEAATRGKNFDPQASGLIIEFADLKDNIAGLTHYETPIRIEIDRTYWDDISKTAGSDLMKENLIFHELGHGLLKRDHLNSTLVNGDWKSIMCGGTKVGDRPWNINYRGERRKYYVDELFDESTPAPDFASLILPIDTTGFTSVYQKNFNTPDQAGWAITDNSKYNTSIDNLGRLRFQSKIDSVYLVYGNISNPISNQSDFSFELTFYYPGTDMTNQYGLIFGTISTGSTSVTDAIEYFTINNNQKMYMGNRTWYSYYTELTESSVVAGGKNKIKVFKKGSMLYYFINNVFCYQSEIETKTVLSQFGFMVPPNGTVLIDNLIISQNGRSNTSLKVKQDTQIEFKIQSTDQFNQKNVKNQ